MKQLEHNEHLKQVMETHKKNQANTSHSSTDSLIRANPSMRFNNETVVGQLDQDLSQFKLNKSSLMQSTFAGLQPYRESIRDIEIEEEDESSEIEIAEQNDGPDVDRHYSEGEIDAKTVVSEVERKFRKLGLHNVVDNHISRIIEDESAEAVMVKAESYKKLYRLVGGACIFAAANLAVIGQTVAGLGTNYYIS